MACLLSGPELALTYALERNIGWVGLSLGVWIQFWVVFNILGSHFILDSGGPYGSLGVDYEFEKLLCKIFGEDFIEQFKIKRPAAWVDLMIAFESRKRAAAPDRTNPLNITLPFSFIDYYKKFRGHSVEHALRKSK